MAKLDEFTELLRDQFAKYKYLDRSFQLETNRFEELLGDIDEFATECLKIHRFLSHRIVSSRIYFLQAASNRWRWEKDLAAQPSLHNDTGRTVDMRDSSIQQLYQQLGGSDGRAGENLERSVAPSKFVLLSVDSICGAATRLAETVEISTKNAERLEGEVMSKAEETLLCKWHDIQFELQSASADLQPLLRGAARSCAAFERDFLRNK
ncbi:hypothetical protein DFJ73DRAFT_157696 [Zopfochytrium polystomum]|nr:hypothetical protein DFJ73DRAFT_157696 [Zopfochytrium polystomum]